MIHHYTITYISAFVLRNKSWNNQNIVTSEKQTRVVTAATKDAIVADLTFATKTVVIQM